MVPVHYSRAGALECSKIVLRVKDPVPVSANVSGGRHAVKQQRELAVRFGDVESVLARVNADVLRATAVEFSEQWTEPVLMLVVDGDRFALLRAHFFLLKF